MGLATIMTLFLVWGGPRAEPNTLPSLPRLLQRHQEAMARVFSQEGRPLGSGFFVASVGYLATAAPGLKLGQDLIIELVGGARRRARVARTQADGLSILAVAAGHEEEIFQTLPLRAQEAGPPQGWLVALCHDQQGRLSPAAGGLRQRSPEGTWELDLPCGPGAPVLCGDEVCGVVLRARGSTAAVGVPLAALRQLSQGLSAKAPRELWPPAAPGPAAPGGAPPAGG